MKNGNLCGVQIFTEGRYDAERKNGEGIYQAVPGISHAAGMFARRKSPLAEALLLLPGPGVSPASVSEYP